jgi:hypothetical protein
MAMVIDICAALSELGQIVAKVKQLSEWARLEREEARPDMPPSFRVLTDTDEDLHFQLGLFMTKDLEVRRFLNHISIPEADRTRQQCELHRLEEQVRGLGLGERFIRP